MSCNCNDSKQHTGISNVMRHQYGQLRCMEAACMNHNCNDRSKLRAALVPRDTHWPGLLRECSLNEACPCPETGQNFCDPMSSTALTKVSWSLARRHGPGLSLVARLSGASPSNGVEASSPRPCLIGQRADSRFS